MNCNEVNADLNPATISVWAGKNICANLELPHPARYSHAHVINQYRLAEVGHLHEEEGITGMVWRIPNLSISPSADVLRHLKLSDTHIKL